MSTQKMKEPRQVEDLFSHTEEFPQETESISEVRKKSADPLIISLGVIALIFAFALGVSLRRDTTLFLEKRSVDGYLPAEEYVLVDSGGKPAQALRTVNYRTLHSWDQGGTLKTSRGIGRSSSWEEFCDAYGDMHAKYITVYKRDSARDYYDYSNIIFLSEPMTVREFHENYIDTGIVRTDRDEIDVTFTAYTDGTKLYYTDAELAQAADQYYSSSWLEQRTHRSPRSRSFSLDFSFLPGEGINYILSTGP